MSKLVMQEASLGSLSSAIFSFWVRGRGANGESVEVPKNLDPPSSIDGVMGRGQVAYPGSSYGMVFPQLTQPHLWCYPVPGPENEGPQPYMDGVVPFIKFGDPDLKVEHADWKLRELNKVWLFGKGGVPQGLVSQFPEKGESVAGIVPTSCIGMKRGSLYVILQMNNKAKYTGCAWAQEKSETVHITTALIGDVRLHCALCDGVPSGYEDFSGKYGDPSQFTGFNFKYADVSMIECAQHPETFIMDTGVSISGGWHHVLVSFDLSGKAAAGAPDAAAAKGATSSDKPDPPDGGGLDPVSGEAASTAKITAESTGPEGPAPYPGTWGQYSGPLGEYALGGGINHTPPYEDVGKYGYATGGSIKSACRAWIAVDGKTVKGAALNGPTYNAASRYLQDFDSNAIAPVNAFLIPGAEIRNDMTTNMTGWEREYRTLLGGFDGPAARIDETDEPRRLDYVRPKYEYSPGSVPVGGKPLIVGHDKVDMAELQIWSGKWLDLSIKSNIELFFDGDPVAPAIAEEKLGKANIKLHWATHWIHGINTGSSGGRTTGSGSGTDPKTVEDKKGQFEPQGEITRTDDPPG